MSFKKLRRIQSDDRTQNQLQDNVGDVLDQITARAHLDSQVLYNVRLVVGEANVVPHKLGRAYSSFLPCSMQGVADVWEDKDNNNSPQLNLILYSNGNITLDLEVW